jgi:hypothetical protein
VARRRSVEVIYHKSSIQATKAAAAAGGKVSPVASAGDSGAAPAGRVVRVAADMPRSRTGTALRHTPGHCVLLESKLEVARIYDEPMLKDALVARWRPVYKLLSLLNAVTTGGFFLLGPLGVLFGPLAVADYTGTTRMLFGGGNNTATGGWGGGATNATLPDGTTNVDEPPPVPRALSALCLGLHGTFCVCATYSFLYLLLFSTSPAMIKLLWSTCRARLTVTVGTALAYAVAAGSLLPVADHALWLVARTFVVVNLCHWDAMTMGLKLRLTPETFAKLLGSDRSGRGWYSILGSVGGLGFLLVDVFRHYLVVNASAQTDVFDFGLTNPITGNRFVWTNHQLAELCYYTSMLFAGQIVVAFTRTRVGRETTLLSTHMLLLDVGEGR